MKPLIKWPGGKRRILKHLRDHLPAEYGTYHEPMIGGGALFFDREPERAYISDINQGLITMYKTVRDSPEHVIEELEKLTAKYARARKKDKFYYRQRDRFNYVSASNGQMAAIFLFLNKTGFNGLWRENKDGKMNVPVGKYANPRFPTAEEIMRASELLSRTIVDRVDFTLTLDVAKEGDLVYFDPPYIPTRDNFTTYSSGGFHIEDHHRLAHIIHQLSERGVSVILSNSDTAKTRDIYIHLPIAKNRWMPTVTEIEAPRSINRDGKGRKPAKELIITNYSVIPERTVT